MSNARILPSTILAPERIIFDATATSKKRIFEEVSLAFENTGGPLRTVVFKCLLERERLGSTMIAPKVAIPHARIKELRKPIAAFFRAREPFAFDSPSSLVRYLFVLLAPERADNTHLQLLSLMSRMLTDNEFMEAVATCPEPSNLLTLMQAWELRLQESESLAKQSVNIS